MTVTIPINDTSQTQTKLDVIRYHIHSSIQMIAIECHPFSTHTIVMACKCLVEDIAKARNVLLDWSHKIWVKEEHQMEFLRLERKAYNYFKHADRDAETQYEGPKIEDLIWLNETQTLTNIQGYIKLSGKNEQMFDTFATLMLLQYPDLFKLNFLDNHPELKRQFKTLDRSRSAILQTLRLQLFKAGYFPSVPPVGVTCASAR